MKTITRDLVGVGKTFAQTPQDYLGLCQQYVPRPLHSETDYAAACAAIKPLIGFEERLTGEQEDYLEAVSTFIEAYDAARVRWPKTTPAETLRFVLEQHQMSASALSRLLGADRSLGPKILRGERRLTLDHVRRLAAHFGVKASAFL
jgi:HTH-type transcriptional regulator / antitoxin HigA